MSLASKPAVVYRRVRRLDAGTRFVLVLSVGLFVGFSVYLWLLYARFALFGTDLGRYTHMFASTLHGTGFLHAGVYRIYIPSGSYWGRHFSLTLLLFLPVYALVPSPVTLLVAKSAVVAASLPALWLVARHHLDDPGLARVVVASYAFNPFLWSAWSFDFQEQAIVPLLVFAAYYAYRRGSPALFLGLLALAMVTNEFMIILAGGFVAGLFLGAARAGRLRERLPVLAAASVLAGGAYLLSTHVKSQFSRNPGLSIGRMAPPVRPLLDGPVTTVGELAGTVLHDPSLVVELLAHDAGTKAAFFLLLVGSAAFLTLGDEVGLAGLAPWLAFAWLFAGKGSAYMFRAHYPMYLLPFVYIGAVRVLDRLALPRLSRRSLANALVLVLALTAAATVAIGDSNQQSVPPPNDEHAAVVTEAIDSIPGDASLVTQNSLYPRVADRPEATLVLNGENFRRYQERYGTVAPEYVLYDEELPWWGPVERAFGDRLGSEYGLYMRQDGVFVWKRGYEGEPSGITREEPG